MAKMLATQILPKLEELLDPSRATYLDYPTRVDRHQSRVTEISTYLAEGIGMSQEEIDILRIIARFHDYAKSIWPNSMIYKDWEDFTTYEHESRRMHPEISFVFLINDLTISNGEILEWLDTEGKTILEAIRYHHEDWDGSGYPYGLKGEEIPLASRIIRIADSYDAMHSFRIYRSLTNQRMEHDRIMQEIHVKAGIEFDLELVRVFEQIEPEKLEVLYAHVPRRDMH